MDFPVYEETANQHGRDSGCQRRRQNVNTCEAGGRRGGSMKLAIGSPGVGPDRSLELGLGTG